jgi:hypothetical protein
VKIKTLNPYNNYNVIIVLLTKAGYQGYPRHLAHTRSKGSSEPLLEPSSSPEDSPPEAARCCKSMLELPSSLLPVLPSDVEQLEHVESDCVSSSVSAGISGTFQHTVLLFNYAVHIVTRICQDGIVALYLTTRIISLARQSERCSTN